MLPRQCTSCWVHSMSAASASATRQCWALRHQPHGCRRGRLSWWEALEPGAVQTSATPAAGVVLVKLSLKLRTCGLFLRIRLLRCR